MKKRFLIYNIWDSRVIVGNFLTEEAANAYIKTLLDDQNPDLLAIIQYTKPDNSNEDASVPNEG